MRRDSPPSTARTADDSREPEAWHLETAASALQALETTEGGLDQAEAAGRLARNGRNELPRAAAAPWWRVLARQFASPLIILLAFAAALSLAIGHATDAAFITVVLVTNALIGGSQEWRAERAAQALRNLMAFKATVLRGGEVRDIESAEVVVGDIILLESGMRVPADGRLLVESGLETDESLLTGESVAVDKDEEWTASLEHAAPLAEQRNMVWAGTTVIRGRGKAVVVATGAASSVGRLAIAVMGAPPGLPPLLERLRRFSRAVGIASIAASALIALLGVVIQGHSVAYMAVFGVALAVSVIPEGLPIAITVALAVASTRMARRGLIVRRLGAVEGLGSCTLIASDKTGTLTCNELTVREVRLASGFRFEVDGEGYAPHGEVSPGIATLAPEHRSAAELLALVAVLCNEADLRKEGEAWSWRGDPTDVALLSMAWKFGVTRSLALGDHAQLGCTPFEPERRYASSRHRFGSEVRVLVKGAPERVHAMCGARERSTLDRSSIMAKEMAASGLRVLAFAIGPDRSVDHPVESSPEPEGLTLLGLVGMIDPLRPEARRAIEACARAGVGTCMVTGDHPVTALAIARELGLAADASELVTGDAFEDLDDQEVRRLMAVRQGKQGPAVRVFARVSPDQKLRIVQAARAAGHFVAVTGDGANDAPALKAANIGVAMGRGGTDVARDASDLVISDDNLATLVAGIEEGRVAYANIRKVIYLLLSTNGAEALLVISAVAMGLPLPLLPVQLLWLNLATEGFQVISLALEPAEPGVLDRPPRSPREPIFNRLMVERLFVGALVSGGVSLGAFWWMVQEGWPIEKARNTLLLLMVLFQNVEVGNARSETRSALALSPLRNPALVAAAGMAVALQALAMHWAPLQRVLELEAADLRTWLLCALLALTVLVAIELHKAVWWWRHRRTV